MKIDEANKIISEYMVSKNSRACILNMPKYSESLDALVTVWRKLKWSFKIEADTDWSVNHVEQDSIHFIIRDKYEPFDERRVLKTFEMGENLAEIACIATAKCIKEITNKE